MEVPLAWRCFLSQSSLEDVLHRNKLPETQHLIRQAAMKLAFQRNMVAYAKLVGAVFSKPDFAKHKCVLPVLSLSHTHTHTLSLSLSLSLSGDGVNGCAAMTYPRHTSLSLSSSGDGVNGCAAMT